MQILFIDVKKIHRFALAASLMALAFLSACASTSSTLYQWQRYQENVNAYFKTQGQDAQTQTLSMQEDLEKIRANGGAVPPGYFAHMGLLYGKQGQVELFVKHLEAEKKEFPESAAFVDFLLRNVKKTNSKNKSKG